MASLRCGATLHVSGANYLSTIVWSDGRSAEDGSTSDMPCHVEEEGLAGHAYQILVGVGSWWMAGLSRSQGPL